MARRLFIGYTTLPTKEASHKLAQTLVEKRLAACVQIDGPISSLYFWDKKVNADEEWRLTVKFSDKTREALKEAILANHEYQCPQWVVVQAADSHQGYSNWVDEVTGEVVPPEE